MPLSVTYATVNGELVEETRGGVTTTYVSDTLGSVIQTRNTAGAQTSSTTYWPFGEVRTSTGSNPSPWGFCGAWGYFKDAVNRQYVRARILRNDLSRWKTVDDFWPSESPYSYAGECPTIHVDPTGNDWKCWDSNPSPCSKFEISGKPYKKVSTPCGTINLPPGLSHPVRGNDPQAWCCWERQLRKAKGGFGYCMSQMAIALINIQIWLHRNNYPGKDKVAHCVIGCFAQKAVDSCCAYFLAIHLENKFWPKGNHDPDDYRATIEGMRCGETLELPGWLWVCRWIPGLNQGTRETFYESCYDCCMHKKRTGILPQR